jgi:uroporphyrinogen decarboxylase
LPYLIEIVQLVKQGIKAGPDGKKAPIILFCKGANHSLTEIAMSGCDVIGLDWTIDISEVKALMDGHVALQGNLDPTVLYATEEVIEEKVRAIAKRMKEPQGHIFNLGHGITPEVDPENARAFVKAAKGAYAGK